MKNEQIIFDIPFSWGKNSKGTVRFHYDASEGPTIGGRVSVMAMTPYAEKIVDIMSQTAEIFVHKEDLLDPALRATSHLWLGINPRYKKMVYMTMELPNLLFLERAFWEKHGGFFKYDKRKLKDFLDLAIQGECQRQASVSKRTMAYAPWWKRVLNNWI